MGLIIILLLAIQFSSVFLVHIVTLQVLRIATIGIEVILP